MRIHKSTIQLLRIPFSINLLPIFLFAVYTAMDNLDLVRTLAVFTLIHFVFYPASNAYNSFMDRDTGSIAGIKHPPAPTKQLYQVSVFLDFIGLVASYFVSKPFLIINFILMLLSRAYSYRGIRLKKYAVLAFLMVASAQGGASFYNMHIGIQGLNYFPSIEGELGLQILAATFFVGAIYPITQIYQHKEDEQNGDRTISMLLGIRGTFVFSGILFMVSMVLLFFILNIKAFLILLACMIIPIIFFLYWLLITWRSAENANFRNTMIMALSASVAMIVGFTIIILSSI